MVCTPRVNLGRAHAQESDKLSPPCALPWCILAGVGDLARAVTLGCSNLIAESPTLAKSRARTSELVNLVVAGGRYTPCKYFYLKI